MKNRTKKCGTVTALILCLWMAAAAMGQENREKLSFEADDSLEDIRFKIEHNGYDFTVDHNWVFDMPSEDKENFLRRSAPVSPRRSDDSTGAGPLLEALRKREDLPAAFDWRNKDGHSYIGPVKNQGQCGSCYSFGANAAAEGTYNSATGKYDADCADFSESFIIWCMGKVSPYSSHFKGCDGADYDYYELQGLTDKGMITESDFAYTTSDPGECQHWDKAAQKFKSWHRVGCNDIEALKTAIKTFGVVDAAVMVNSAFEAYKSGIYEDTNTACDADPCYYAQTNHAVALVGWGEQNGKGYWILRNSWGTEWGELGYMRIAHTAAKVSCATAYLVYDAKSPVVSTEAADSVTAVSAKINGKVNPNGTAATYYFEYGDSTKYGKKTTEKSAGSGSSAAAVSETLSMLAPNTTYHYRLVAKNTSGTSYGEDQTFFTFSGTAAKPKAVTGQADNMSFISATLNGTVNPMGAAARYYFDYGTTSAYGSVSSPPGVTEIGSADIAVKADISKLTPGTTYHYRLVAENTSGKTLGEDRTFTTGGEQLAVNFLQDGGFESGMQNPYWTDISKQWESNIYQQDEVTQALAGDWFVWFSGIEGLTENASLAQTAVFPSQGEAVLKFWLMMFSDPTGILESGTLNVKIDNETVFTSSEKDADIYPDWKEIAVDVSKFADGESHTLTFGADFPLGAITSFLIDDVSLEGKKTTGGEGLKFDVNSDGKVNLGDVIYLLKMFAGGTQ